MFWAWKLKKNYIFNPFNKETFTVIIVFTEIVKFQVVKKYRGFFFE